MPKPTSELPDNQVTPNPNLEKRTRRSFSPEYKQRILAQADACRHGELGELLRREKLFSGQLTAWRKERDAGGMNRPGYELTPRSWTNFKGCSTTISLAGLTTIILAG